MSLISVFDPVLPGFMHHVVLGTHLLSTIPFSFELRLNVTASFEHKFFG